MRALFAAIAVCTSFSALGLVSFSTTRLDVSPPGVQARVAIGDVDADGANELVVISGSPATAAAIFSIAPGGAATLEASVPLAAAPSASWTYAQPRIVDVDGDGDRDIALYLRADGEHGLLQLVKWDRGTASFVTDGPYTMPESDAAYGFDVGDIDGDGVADVVTANHGRNAPQAIFVTAGASGYSSFTAYELPFNGAPGAFGPNQRGIVFPYARDLDRDGRIDVVVSTAPYNNITARIFWNRPGLGLTTTQDLPGRASIELGFGDRNGDGKPEIIATGDHAPDLKVYNSQLGYNGSVATLRVPSDPRTPLVGDFSGDGVNDTAVAMTFNKNVIVIVGGTQGSTPVNSADFDAADFMSDSYVQELASGDVDNDGKLDLLFATDRVIWIRAAVSDTVPPVLTAPSAVVVEATSAAGATATWMASAADAVSGTVAVQCTPASGSLFALGNTTVKCQAKDAANNTATKNITVTVRDTTAPALSVPPGVVVEAAFPAGAYAVWTSSATDLVSGAVAVQCTPASGSLFALGNTAVQCQAADAANNIAARSFVVTVRDTSAPAITSVTATPGVLRSPNHKMVAVTVGVTAVDAGDAAPVARITKVTSNEPENFTGDGDTGPDWAITGPLTLDLRSERSGRGNGRVYTITVEVADRSGNIAYGSTTVTVPK